MWVAAAAEYRLDTIYALSSGRLPAAIAVMRVSGPAADRVLAAMVGRLPVARRASLRTVRDVDGEAIDRALVLRFPGPDTATGEDLAEFHFHGSRAVVAAAARSFAALGCREAQPGEFTRRALLAGRTDFAETEALADLLEAETENQHRAAIRRSSGATARLVQDWTGRLTELAAAIEHLIDHDEDDGDPAPVMGLIRRRLVELDAVLAAPSVSRMRDGVRVVFAGPPNAGKSSLFNRILGYDASIVSPRPGTTRDVNERAVDVDGIAFVLVDTAGTRETVDTVEADGVARARAEIAGADIVVDLGDDAAGAKHRIAVAAQCDRRPPVEGRIATSAITGAGVDVLLRAVVAAARAMTGTFEHAIALDDRHRAALADARSSLAAALAAPELVIAAEYIRAAIEAVTGLAGFEASETMLDTLFARFCVGK